MTGSGLSFAGLTLLTFGSVAALASTNSAENPAPPPEASSWPPVPLTDDDNRAAPVPLEKKADDLGRANALYAQALINISTSDPHQTLDLLRQVTTLDPHFADAQVRIANMMLQLGQIEPALAQLQAAFTANPGSAAIEAALGYVQHLRGQREEAVRLCSAALKQDVTQSICMRVLLESAGEQDDLAGGVLHAEDILKDATTKVPSDVWLALAKIYVEIARTDLHAPSGDTVLRTLLPIYQQAASGDPAEVEPLTLLADTYRDLGRRREALGTLQKAAQVDPTNADLIARCGDLEAGLGEKSDALRDYETAYNLDPNLAGLRELLGRFYLDDHRFADAAALLEEALVEAPRDPGLLIDLGVAYCGLHLGDKAQACFQLVFDSDTCPPEAYLKLAAVQLNDKQTGRALATLAAAENHFPRSGRVLFYHAIAERYAKNYDAALKDLADMRQLSIDPDPDTFNVNYYLETALNQSLSKHDAAAEATLHDGLLRYPDSADLLNELAYYWADANKKLNEARDYGQRALTLDPDNGAIQDTCGWIEYRQGHYHDALPYLQRGAVLTDNDPVVLQHLGDDYLKLGRNGEALATWRKALKQDPDNHDLIDRIDTTPAQANHDLRSAPHK